LEEYQERIEGDERTSGLHDKARHAKTPEDRKAIQAEAETNAAPPSPRKGGLTERIEDKDNHPKAKAAIKRRKTAIEDRVERNVQLRATHNGATEVATSKPTKAGANLFKKAMQLSPK